MKVLNDRKVIFVILIIIGILGIIFVCNSITDKTTILDEVKLKGEKKVPDGLAIMLENDTNDGKYAESKSSMWPSSTDYRFNKELSGCIDNDGNTIEDALTYNKSTNSVSIKTKSNISCYMYFDLKFYLSELCNSGDNLGSCLTTNNEEIDSLNNNIEGGLYRYQGTNEIVNDNYICFGTNDKEECTSNIDAYMYRIIGVTSEANDTLGLETNQLKLIKHTSIGTHEWYSSHSTDTNWESSTMYTHLQNNVLSNTSYIPSGWSNKISSVKWNIGDVQTYTNGDTVYGLEDNTQTTNTSKVGLMYLSDYYYAYNAGGTQNCISSPYCVSWMTDTSNVTWTMSRYGYNSVSGVYDAWRVYASGKVESNFLISAFAVRPVFYLNSDEQYISGDGTIDNPIIVSGPIMHTVNVSSNNTTYGTVTPTTQEVVDTGNATITISPNTGYKYTSNTCGVEPVDNVITISNVTSDKTCTVTFTAASIGTTIQGKKPTGLNSSMQGGLYRFQGTTADNYICFGTSDKSTCTGNTDAYMYRIIGINSSGQLKLIKKEALNTVYYWNNACSNTSWTDSDLFKGLNGISGIYYSNLFIGNSTYMPSGWSDKIADTNWKIGDNTNVNQTAQALYNTEDAWTAGQTAYKIGLMYAHDFAYGLSGGNNCSTSGAFTTCKTSWLHLSNNDSGAPLPYEWTMSRYGYGYSYFGAWSVFSDGFLTYSRLDNEYAVRPVFYLKSSVNFIGGTGTASDPFIIE